MNEENCTCDEDDEDVKCAVHDVDTTDLEEEFKKLVEGDAGQALQLALDQAKEALARAEEIAEKHGIPFQDGISYMNNAYIPDKFCEKFKDLDPEFISELTGVWDMGEYELGGGWQHSDLVC